MSNVGTFPNWIAICSLHVSIHDGESTVYPTDLNSNDLHYDGDLNMMVISPGEIRSAW